MEKLFFEAQNLSEEGRITFMEKLLTIADNMLGVDVVDEAIKGRELDNIDPNDVDINIADILGGR